jgi:hypothetical protein
MMRGFNFPAGGPESRRAAAASITGRLRLDSALYQPGGDQPVVSGKFGT